MYYKRQVESETFCGEKCLLGRFFTNTHTNTQTNTHLTLHQHTQLQTDRQTHTHTETQRHHTLKYLHTIARQLLLVNCVVNTL